MNGAIYFVMHLAPIENDWLTLFCFICGLIISSTAITTLAGLIYLLRKIG